MDLRYNVGPVDPVGDEIVGPDLFAAFLGGTNISNTSIWGYPARF